jgi:hypothetical protein
MRGSFMVQAHFKTLHSTTKEVKRFIVLINDGTIPTITRDQWRRWRKGMDVEVLNQQPSSTSKVVFGKTKCPMSIWLITPTEQRPNSGTDSRGKKGLY